MGRTILRTLLTFMVVMTFNFFIPRLIPGDPFSHLAGSDGKEMAGLSEEDIARLEKYYGLDDSLPVQYVTTIKDNLKGDFGQSILYKRPVVEIVGEKLPWTLYLLLIGSGIGLILGILLAVWGLSSKRLDRFLHSSMTVISEFPSFVVGIGFLFLVAAKVSWLPLAGNKTVFTSFDSLFEEAWDILKHSLMPLATLVVINTPGFYFTSRVSLNNTQNYLYVKSAKSRGVARFPLLTRYLLRNSMVPIVTSFLMNLGWVLGGTMIVENIFAYPGLGQTMREAVLARDVILLQGILLTSTIIVLLSSLISEYYMYRQRRY